jgi:biopolymer transport protein ExbD
MRRVSLYRQQRRDLDVKMTPMIDVVFLLLVFFIWTASFRISEQLLPSHISASSAAPSAASDVPAPEEDFDDVVIRVFWSDGGPRWEVNGTPVAALDQVRRSLAALAAIKTDAPVIIHPDPDVPLGHVIDLYDITRLEGFEKVQFAASEPVHEGP